MDKPTVFLSHSSADSKALRLLKDLLSAKTGGALALFLSSDGQSIPLGRNWVHSIQTALESCQLMFVFVTPASLHSTWLFFESGFAYSRRTRVVPVALLGVDLKEVAPPLSLLQGFNVTSAAGLNNLLAVINEEFDHRHKESFTENDYARVLAASPTRTAAGLTAATQSVQTVLVRTRAQPGTTVETLASVLADARVEHERGRNGLLLFGAAISIDGSRTAVVTRVSVALWPSFAPTLVSLARATSASNEVDVFVEFDERVETCLGVHNVTARLVGTEVALGADDRLRFREAHFMIDQHDKRVYLEIRCAIEDLVAVPVLDLVDLLFERNVLYWAGTA